MTTLVPADRVVVVGAAEPAVGNIIVPVDDVVLMKLPADIDGNDAFVDVKVVAASVVTVSDSPRFTDIRILNKKRENGLLRSESKCNSLTNIQKS